MLNPLAKPDDSSLRSVDRELLSTMQSGDWFSVGDLTDALGVTATAVRQRVERLLERELIEREKIVAGRGRPTYHYRVTEAGRRESGADSTHLAEAMWRELTSIDDLALRERLLASVAKRLGQEYAARLDPDAPLADRMKVLSQMLGERRVASDVVSDGNLPILDINACPYPTLADGSIDHSMCRLEEKVLSEALGKDIQLSQCRLDGDACCQFAPSDAGD
ncbi:MAG: ArsR family transcriptional regulator [Planctomycetota bacterium]